MQFKFFHSALPDKHWIRILKRGKSKHWLAYCFFPVVNPQVCSLARELWYGIIIKAPPHPASEMLLPPPCMKGKQDLSSDIALEQADYRSLVILLDACFVLDLPVLPPKELKKSSQLLLTTHRGLPLTSVSLFPFHNFTFSKDASWIGKYSSLGMGGGSKFLWFTKVKFALEL